MHHVLFNSVFKIIMFNIYYINELEQIYKTLLSLMFKEKPKNLFCPDIILLDDISMSELVKINIVESLDIIGNIEFKKISNFIWDISNLILPDISKHNEFTQSKIKWEILNIIPEIFKNKEYKGIFKYFTNTKDKHFLKFKFASIISELFYKYSIHNINWINCLKKNLKKNNLDKNFNDFQIYQSKIWKIIKEKKRNTRLYNYLELFNKLLKNKDKIYKSHKIPKKIFIITSYIPPIYLRIINLFKQKMDIFIIFKISSLNSCKIIQKTISQILFNKNCNSFRQFKIYSIYGYKKILYKNYKRNNLNFNKFKKNKFLKNSNLLHEVQNYIFNNISINIKDIFLDYKTKLIPISYYDDSLTIHACDNYRTEIELLYKNILILIRENKSIKLEDIIVVIPKIENYIPIIYSVFKDFEKKNNLPFNISDELFIYKYPILKFFLKILNLPNIECSIEEIFNLLEFPTLSKKFEINNDDIDILKNIIYQSGIHLGEKEKEKLFTNKGLNTWQSGFKRIILGYLTNDRDIWNNIVPYNDYNEDLVILINKLFEFTDKIFYWKDWLSKLHSKKKWKYIINKIIKDFFEDKKKDINELKILRNKWYEIFDNLIQINYEKKVYINLIRQEIYNWLNKKKKKNVFLKKTINFCTFESNRLISAKVIYMVGMNSNFDYQNNKNFLDIINENINIYHLEKNKKKIFLEYLLFSKDKIYISFSRYNNKKEKIYISNIVNELKYYIYKNFFIYDINNINIKNSEARLVKELINKDNTEYSNILYYNTKYYSKNYKNKGINFIQELPEKKNINIKLKDLIKFYIHPIKAFFNIKLNVYLPFLYRKVHNNHKLFTVSKEDDLKIKSLIIKSMIQKSSLIDLFNQINASGILPYGNFGKVYWEQTLYFMNNIFKNLKNYLKGDLDNIDFSVKIENFKLYGSIKNIFGNSIVRYQPRKLYIKDGLTLFIEHLIYCLVKNNANYSIMVGENSEWYFPNLGYNSTKNELLLLILGFIRGMKSPLLLPIKSGSSWIYSCFDYEKKVINWEEKKQKEAINDLLKVWNGYSNIEGEKNDFYIRRTIQETDINKKIINKFILYSSKYLLPVLKFSK